MSSGDIETNRLLRYAAFVYESLTEMTLLDLGFCNAIRGFILYGVLTSLGISLSENVVVLLVLYVVGWPLLRMVLVVSYLENKLGESNLTHLGIASELKGDREKYDRDLKKFTNLWVIYELGSIGVALIGTMAYL